MLHPKLLGKLVELRKILERPVYITSGYRCLRYNQKIGGVVNSYHRIGLAADIKVKDINLITLLEVCENIDFAGIGFYEKKNFLQGKFIKIWDKVGILYKFVIYSFFFTLSNNGFFVNQII